MAPLRQADQEEPIEDADLTLVAYQTPFIYALWRMRFATTQGLGPLSLNGD